MREILARAGAVCEQPMRLMRRALIEEPQHTKDNAFIRIRDEGDKVTMTYKKFHDEAAIGGVRELEVQVSSFDDTVKLLELAGWPAVTYQESKRETWRLNDVEIVVDEWPWIAPYIEVEGPSEERVRRVAEELGFDWKDAVVGSVDVIYSKTFPNKTNRGVIDIREVRFDDPVPKEFIIK